MYAYYVEVKLDRLLFLFFLNLGFYVPIDSLAMICSSFTPRFTVAFDHVVLCKRVANFLSFVCFILIWYQFQKFLICNFVLKFNCWYKWYCKSKKNLWSRNKCADFHLSSKLELPPFSMRPAVLLILKYQTIFWFLLYTKH